MALAATVISVVTFIIFLLIAIFAFVAYGDVDLVACSAQSAVLQEARQYLLGVGIISIVIMIIIIIAAVIGWGSWFERSKSVSLAFVVLAIFYIVAFLMVTILAAIGYSKLVTANCNLSNTPAAAINALIITLASGILAVFYILFLFIWYRNDLKKLFKSEDRDEIKIKGDGKKTEEIKGEELLRKVEKGRKDVDSLTKKEEDLIDAAFKRRKRLQEVKEKAGLTKKEDESRAKRREDEARRRDEETRRREERRKDEEKKATEEIETKKAEEKKRELTKKQQQEIQKLFGLLAPEGQGDVFPQSDPLGVAKNVQFLQP